MASEPIGFIGTGHAMKIVNNVLTLAEEVGYEPRVTAEAIRWFRDAMTGSLAGGDHVEVVKLIGYPEGGRS